MATNQYGFEIHPDHPDHCIVPWRAYFEPPPYLTKSEREHLGYIDRTWRLAKQADSEAMFCVLCEAIVGHVVIGRMSRVLQALCARYQSNQRELEVLLTGVLAIIQNQGQCDDFLWVASHVYAPEVMERARRMILELHGPPRCRAGKAPVMYDMCPEM